QRAKMIEMLAKDLDKKQLDRLLNASLGYRLGQTRHTDFYLYLRELCEINHVGLKEFPAMNSYIQYVLLSDRIDSEKLFDEVKVLEDDGYRVLAKTAQEKKLVEKSKGLYLVSKILDFSFGPNEWKEYRLHGEAINSLKEEIRRKFGKSDGFNLDSFERFFE